MILLETCSFIKKIFQKSFVCGFPSNSDQSQKRAVFGTFSWLLNDPEFSRTNGPVRFLVLSCWSCVPSFGKILRAVLQILSWLTDRLTFRGLTSTEVENCNVLLAHAQLQAGCLLPYCCLNKMAGIHIFQQTSVVMHLVLSQYAISSRPNRPNSRKMPNAPFTALWIIQKGISVIF